MRKVQFTAVMWTMILAVPLTALALSILAYTTEHLTQIATSVSALSRDVSIGGRGLIVEFAQRWPEVAGMVIGQVVLFSIFLFLRQSKKADQKAQK
jgi:hypothetical protein